MKAVLIGCGEIGRAVKEVFEVNNEIEVCEINRKPKGEFEIMLVAIPYSDDFIKIVTDYQEEYKVKGTIIFSTVPIGTTAQIPGAVHSPVEGKHPNLASSIRKMPRWVGGCNETARDFIFTTFDSMVALKSSDWTEFLKLRSTSKYGVNIQFARYEKSVCDALAMEFDLVKDFDKDYNELYDAMGMPQFKRYILDAPEGAIGGHCVVPNAKLLDAQYPSELLKEIYKGDENES